MGVPRPHQNGLSGHGKGPLDPAERQGRGWRKREPKYKERQMRLVGRKVNRALVCALHPAGPHAWLRAGDRLMPSRGCHLLSASHGLGALG